MSNELPADFKTMRPIRVRRDITITVGQDEGDLRGADDKVLQAAVDYVHGLGGGTVRVLPGIYTMRNALYLRPGITLRGSGEETVLKKASTVESPLVREADWFEYCVQVADPAGFTIGCGLALSNNKPDWPEVRIYTVTAIQRNVLYLDRRTEKNYWMSDSATARTIHSVLHAVSVDDVRVEDIVLDGNRGDNGHVNGNYVGAVFMQYCNRWRFKNVTARNYNGDGFSFQVCDDIQFDECSALNNADLGFHPGSGSQRPVFRDCTSKGNSQGIFWCWSACDGVAENCVVAGNLKYGINIGHRDTDNVIRGCTIERNGEVGVIFRKEKNEGRTGDRNLIENCVIRDNGGDKPGCGIDIQWKTKDITIRNCRFENTKNGNQRVAVRVSPEAERVTLEGNTFKDCPVEIEDHRPEKAK